MPELPEVEVTRRTLLKFIEKKVIKNYQQTYIRTRPTILIFRDKIF